METKGSYKKAQDYIESHSADPKLRKKKGPCITVSRQSGAGSGLVDDILRGILESAQGDDFGPWAVFDRNLIEKVIEDHNLPERLALIMTAESRSAITTAINEMLGLQPSMRTLYRKTAETIMQLAEMGNVIIVGRAGNIITKDLKNCFHVRLVSEKEDRIRRIMSYYSIARKEAAAFIEKEDEERRELFRKNFRRDIEDPSLYHMVLNTHLLSYEDCAFIIASAVKKKFPKMFES